jgi:tetratricopeptide (TPR) repeat protein
MTKIRLIALLIILPLMLHALPKEILADKYLVGAKTSIDKQDYKSADDYFQKIIDLDIALPDDFYFQYGRNSLTLKDYNKALKYVNLYLEKAGSAGKYYRDALLMSNQAEEGIKEKELKKQQWDRYRVQQEEKRRIEAAIPRYSLTIVTTPSNAKVQIKYIKDTYSDGMRLKKGTYSLKVSKKGYKTKEFTVDLNQNIKKTVKLTQIKKKVKKSSTVWHCTAKSDRASGWVERVGLQNAKNGALKQCNMRRQTNSYCKITNCYKVR